MRAAGPLGTVCLLWMVRVWNIFLSCWWGRWWGLWGWHIQRTVRAAGPLGAVCLLWMVRVWNIFLSCWWGRWWGSWGWHSQRTVRAAGPLGAVCLLWMVRVWNNETLSTWAVSLGDHEAHDCMRVTWDFKKKKKNSMTFNQPHIMMPYSVWLSTNLSIMTSPVKHHDIKVCHSMKLNQCCCLLDQPGQSGMTFIFNQLTTMKPHCVWLSTNLLPWNHTVHDFQPTYHDFWITNQLENILCMTWTSLS